MRILRNDLTVVPAPGGGGCRVLDESTGGAYEFGAIEQFLIEKFSRPYEIRDVVAECNARFGLEYGREDIEEFEHLLAQWDLLEECAEYDDLENPPGMSATVEDGGERHEASGSVHHTEIHQRPNRWHLFDPERLLDQLLAVVKPLRYPFLWSIPLVFMLGAVIVMHNSSNFVSDLRATTAEFGLVGRLLFAAASVNLASQIGRGLVARHFCLSTPSFGFLLLFGLIPRFNLQVKADGIPSRRARLWLSATSTLVRLALAGAAVIIWATTRRSGTFLPNVAVEITLLSMVSLVFVANPLWRGDGSNFLSAWLDIPDVYKRSRNAMLGIFIKQPVAIVRHGRHRWLFGLLGIASATFFLAVLGFISLKVFSYLEGRYDGAGVAAFLLLAAYVTVAVRRQMAANRLRSQSVQEEREASAQAGGGHTSQPQGSRGLSGANTRSRGRLSGEKSSSPWLVYLVPAMLLLLLILPYEYETGGEAEVLPMARASIAAETDGVVENVYFDGGEWVAAGTPIARQADHRQIRDLLVTEASITAMRHEIELLRATPFPEELHLAEVQLETARLQLAYSINELERIRELHAQGGVSSQSFDSARRTVDLDRQFFAEAHARLQMIKHEVKPGQIKSLEAQLERLDREADFYNEQLRRTRLLAPISGYLVGSDLRYYRNSYLEAGQTFAEVEDTSEVLIRIAIPESDLGEVAVGALVTIKFWAYPDRTFGGTVDKIDPSTEEADYGRVIYVTSRIDNSSQLLKSGLGGHAKIVGNETRAIFAFTRAFIRFVRIELWSWLP